MATLEHGRTQHSARPTSGWVLADSMQAILRGATWECLAETLCEELTMNGEIAAVWAIRWPDADAGELVAAAGNEALLKTADKENWPSQSGGLLSLALSSPLRHHPANHDLLGPRISVGLLRELHDVILIPLIQRDNLPWTLVMDLNRPLLRPELLYQRLQELWDAQQRSQLHAMLARACEGAANSMFITNADGTIEWVNAAFTALTGFKPHEAIGHKPNILNSGKQSARYYRKLWQTILNGDVWVSEAVDKDRYGYLYTIQQTISPIMENDRPVQFLSIHDDISQRKTLQAAHERQQYIDAETGLLTPTAFLDEINRAIHQAQHGDAKLAVISLSLVNFNSALSALSVERRASVTREIAARITTTVGNNLPITHFGHGDFGLLLGPRAPQENLLLSQLTSTLNAPYSQIDGSPFFTLSWGLAHFPDDGSDGEQLWKLADSANGLPQENTGQ